MISRIQLFRVEMIADNYKDVVKGDRFHAVKSDEDNFTAFAGGEPFFIPADKVLVLAQLFPVARTGMQLVEDELSKVKA